MGVERDADADAIKRAYRMLARKYHPDVSSESDAEAKFKEVGEAYEVLKDAEKRTAYDQLGENWRAGESFQPPPDWGSGFEFSSGGFDGGFSNADSAAHSDFFDSLFGHAFSSAGSSQRGNSSGPQYQQQNARDHHAKIIIALEDSLTGAKRNITLQVANLDAQGRLSQRPKTLSVKIPKGIKSGQHIRLGGQAESAIAGTPAGDLYLEIAIEPHHFYQLKGSDLYYDLPVTPWEAALGASIKVPTPGGPVQLKIPAGSKSGTQLLLRGKGIPSKPAGDLYVELQIILPAANTEQAKQLYKEMEKSLSFNPRANLGV